MTLIRFALVGCGNIGLRHAELIQSFGKLIAVCDTVPEKAQDFGNRFKVPFHTDLSVMLDTEEGIDVVVICTPNGLHASQAIRAFEKNCHVLVEKPMALSVQDCNRMIQSANTAGKQLFTVMQNRFNPPVMAVKQALDQNAFGKISSIQLTCFWNREAAYYADSWRGSLALDGGVLFTQFSHFIDLLLWLFGEVVQVEAYTQNADHKGIIAFEDVGVVILRFANGILGTLHFSVNSFGKNREGSLAILGTKGIAKIGGTYLNTIEYQDFADYSLSVPETVSAPNDYGSYQGSMR
ncbi:MAG: Gfo/Idh/MocA family oxidoreductase, partial [Bacteroidota bacterium]|nr:Gfo/Idh/MocA family oxidoreductase [Bacteroidota bacterium]